MADPKQFTTFWCEVHGCSASSGVVDSCAVGDERDVWRFCRMVEVQVTKIGPQRQ